MSTAPVPFARSARAVEIAAAARAILDAEGPDALTMRRLGHEVGMRAPSLYKHYPKKRALEAAIVDLAFAEMGERLHAAVEGSGPDGPVDALLVEYRAVGREFPNLYRLATGPELPREELTPGLEAWAGEPFFLATGEPHLAQALWAFAHGMTILEIEGRFMGDSDLDRTWRAGATAFAEQVATARPA